MGCGCGGGSKRPSKVRTIGSRSLASGNNLAPITPVTNFTGNSNKKVLTGDRRRIDKIRREAIRKALGR